MVTLPTDWTPNDAPTAAEIGQVLTAIDALGYVTSIRESTFNAACIAETLVTSAQFTAVAGARYEVTYRGPSESSVAADGMTSRIRWKHTVTADLTGTPLDSTITYADVINHTIGNVWLTGDFVAVSSTTITVVISMARLSGTGNTKPNCTQVNGVLRINCTDPA
jgi:hypothetical protein